MTLTVERATPTTIVLRRRFAAPPARVYQAHIEHNLVRRWMCGEGGTILSVCDIDARVGGAITYRWSWPDGSGFSLTGTFKVLEPPHRIVHVEVMHLPDPTPENLIETRFDDDGQVGTQMTMTMTLPDAQTAADLAGSGMADGMTGCYLLLDTLVDTASP